MERPIHAEKATLRIYRSVCWLPSQWIRNICLIDKPALGMHADLHALTRRAREDTERLFRARIGTIGCRKNSEKLCLWNRV